MAAMLALLPAGALAHKASDAYLQLRALPAAAMLPAASAVPAPAPPGLGPVSTTAAGAVPTGIELRWDIALRDLDTVVDIDADGDSRITWGEVKRAWNAIDAYALPRLAFAGCPLRVVRHGLEQRSDGAYAVLWMQSPCVLPAEPSIDYTLLKEVDPTHRGILKIERAGQPVQLRLLDPARRPAPEAPRTAASHAPGVTSGSAGVPLALGSAAPAGEGGGADAAAASAPVPRTAAAVQAPVSASAPAAPRHLLPAFLREGIHHILTGYDHVLFLLCLLLPAVMRRTPQGWQPVATLRRAVWPVVGIVSAFTVAHSITLALAALKLATLPSWFIEPAIAVTIVLAALDNLVPVLRLPRAAVTFLFGLVHGFGFAGVLAELDLPASAFAWALLEFNVGLELGQLAIVFAVTALLYALRGWHGYPRWVIGAGSAAAIAVGALWFVERTARVSLLPF